jgi:hypothetical protein
MTCLSLDTGLLLHEKCRDRDQESTIPALLLQRNGTVAFLGREPRACAPMVDRRRGALSVGRSIHASNDRCHPSPHSSVAASNIRCIGAIDVGYRNHRERQFDLGLPRGLTSGSYLFIRSEP